ncbi:MAG: elongation factor Ts [Lachnospiraceae bacterium]|nr:elongation factor Ts [Lachnospiraceae bacterium]
MAISASMVKELRDMTGAGMMDCKKALTNTDGDMDKAVEWLRENGLAKAEKKAGRIAAEGMVAVNVSEDGKTASIVEVNSETDFVAKNEVFQGMVNSVAKQAAKTSATDLEAFMAEPWIEDSSVTVEENLKNMIAKIGENMNIRRFQKVEAANGLVVSYIHAGGKIGVLVSAETANTSDEAKACLKDVAMQVAALTPKYTSRDEVDQSYIEKEKEVLFAQAKLEKPDAPDKIINGMVMGRINKELKEICLLDQVFVKAEDGKQTVGQYVQTVSKDLGEDIKITGFVRFETGEGLEKKEEDFAAEVAAQMK